MLYPMAVTTISALRTTVSKEFLYMFIKLIRKEDRMMNGLEHIRSMIGDEESSKLSDTDIVEALYHYYFDVEQATAWLLGSPPNLTSVRIYLNTLQRNKNVDWQPKRAKVSPSEP